MTRRPSTGELLLGVLVAALVAFVGIQVLAAPRKLGASTRRTLTARDSASIASQYRSQISMRRGASAVPPWLAEIQIARLLAAAERDVGGRDAVVRPPADSVRAMLATAERGTYLRAMLGQDGEVARWHESAEPIRVWVQPQSTERGFSPEFIAPTRRAFTAWNELALGVTFAIVEDSTEADVHVMWSSGMPGIGQLGTTFRMTGGAGWIAFARVVLCTSYDIYTVQNAARHEAGHVLGLGHSPEVRDIMAAATEGRQYQLTDADRGTAEWLYRLPPGPIENRE
ncbi:MAG TPA: matrixin family metalloprotease [Gemmatimonadaceae bacterium]|nr:matrixin family metalloprotease [Gemmatimonadaceae bacterium]